MSERTCDICRVKPATRILVRSDFGGDGARMLTCGACKPPEGEWSSMALDADGLAKEYEAST